MSNQTVALFLAADVFCNFQNPTTGVFGNPKKFEVEKFEITTPSDLKEKISKGRETFGQAFVSHRVAKPTEFSMTFAQVSRDVFAMALSGVVEEFTDTVETITDLSVTVVLDEWVSIGKENINPTGLTVKNSAGTTTYDKDVDYEINPRLGLIKALSGGEIVAGVVKIAGATLASTGATVIGARQYKHMLQIKVDGKNQIDNKNVLLTALQATVSAEDARDFLSGELDSVTVKGRLEIPPGGDRPFEMKMFN